MTAPVTPVTLAELRRALDELCQRYERVLAFRSAEVLAAQRRADDELLLPILGAIDAADGELLAELQGYEREALAAIEKR